MKNFIIMLGLFFLFNEGFVDKSMARCGLKCKKKKASAKNKSQANGFLPRVYAKE